MTNYHQDIKPIIDSVCTRCHTSGKIAPFSLTNFGEVYLHREAIKRSVMSGSMPPWKADPDCNEFKGDYSLSLEERFKIAGWVDSGAQRGDPKKAVAPLDRPQTNLSRVDQEIGMTEAYTLTGDLDDEYRCFVLDWPYDTNQYVTGFVLNPGNRAIAHHSIAFLVAPEKAAEAQALDTGDGYYCFGGPGLDVNLSQDFSSISLLGLWAPGGEGMDYPEGTGIKVRPGSKIILQMHYHLGDLTLGIPTDQSSMGFKVDDHVAKEALVSFWTNPNWLSSGNMPIEAGVLDRMHEFSFEITRVRQVLETWPFATDEDVHLHGAALHMHERGSRASLFINRSSGPSTCLLNIPKWDFDWQSFYLLKDPVRVKRGDFVSIECHWNNEGRDYVEWGEGTDDEMCLGILYLTRAD